MNREHMAHSRTDSETILTVDENGQEIEVPVADIPKLRTDPYHWGDAMEVKFNRGEDDD